jgi:hypothetical protein
MKENAMTEDNLDPLLQELEAIQLWDQSYLLATTHDEIDRTAWESRRERQAQIFALLTEAKLLKFPAGGLD